MKELQTALIEGENVQERFIFNIYYFDFKQSCSLDVSEICYYLVFYEIHIQERADPAGEDGGEGQDGRGSQGMMCDINHYSVLSSFTSVLSRDL